MDVVEEDAVLVEVVREVLVDVDEDDPILSEDDVVVDVVLDVVVELHDALPTRTRAARCWHVCGLTSAPDNGSDANKSRAATFGTLPTLYAHRFTSACEYTGEPCNSAHSLLLAVPSRLWALKSLNSTMCV